MKPGVPNRTNAEFIFVLRYCTLPCIQRTAWPSGINIRAKSLFSELPETAVLL
jgi:hypothetical protein